METDIVDGGGVWRLILYVIPLPQRAVLYHDLEIELLGKRKVPICHMTSHALEWAPTEGLIVDDKQRSEQLLLCQVS